MYYVLLNFILLAVVYGRVVFFRGFFSDFAFSTLIFENLKYVIIVKAAVIDVSIILFPYIFDFIWQFFYFVLKLLLDKSFKLKFLRNSSAFLIRRNYISQHRCFRSCLSQRCISWLSESGWYNRCRLTI